MIFKNAISWFEVPTTELNRSQKFYETLFDITMIPLDKPAIKMRMFPLENMADAGGAFPDVQLILNRIETAGGKIIIPKTEISPEYGYMAVLMDTDGNRMALHSLPQS